MYCQTCGTECQPGLNFCNRCGATVNARQELAPVDIRSPVRVLGVTLCLTTLVGFAILFIGLSGMASWGLRSDAIAPLGVMGMLVLLGVDLALIRLLSRLLGATPQKRFSLPFTKASATKELYAPPAQYAPTLPAGVPGSSVTDHTTRTFSPVYREPRG